MDAYQSRLSALKDDVFKKHAAYARKVSLGFSVGIVLGCWNNGIYFGNVWILHF